MDEETDAPQRIARLTPLAEVLAAIEARVRPVASREIAVPSAAGCVLAADVVVHHPPMALALWDGFAVRAECTADASGYAPVPLKDAARIDTGVPLPEGADAVVPLDLVTVRDGAAEAAAPVAPGDGVLPAGTDASGTLLRQGVHLPRLRVAVLAAAEVTQVTVREPRVRLAAARQGDAVSDAARELLAGAIAAAGGCVPAGKTDDAPFASADADAVVVIGGTGTGATDRSARMLAQHGEVAVHGIAIAPGETAAFGFLGHRPVLLVPGRLDAAMAVWLLLGRYMLDRLSGCTERPPALTARLSRKVASTLGLAQVVPVRLRGGTAEPLASGYLPLGALVQAGGWILVAPDSEGYASGAEVMVRPWP